MEVWLGPNTAPQPQAATPVTVGRTASPGCFGFRALAGSRPPCTLLLFSSLCPLSEGFWIEPAFPPSEETFKSSRALAAIFQVLLILKDRCPKLPAGSPSLVAASHAWFWILGLSFWEKFDSFATSLRMLKLSMFWVSKQQLIIVWSLNFISTPWQYMRNSIRNWVTIR